MRRLTFNLTIAALAFILGIGSWLFSGKIGKQPSSIVPLQVYSQSMNIAGPQPISLIVKNVSEKTVSGYSLIREDCLGAGRIYALNSILMPNASEVKTIDSCRDAKIKVEYVKFSDGSEWGAVMILDISAPRQ